jgi:hypothetical protein
MEPSSRRGVFDTATVQVYRQIALAFGPSVFHRTRARMVSQKLLGDFPFPELIPKCSNQGPDCFVEKATDAWETMAAETDDGTGVFPDIHTLLFFLEPLAVGRKLPYRGHANSEWALESTYRRRIDVGWNAEAIQQAKTSFLQAVNNLSDRRHVELLPNQQEGVCQHYGFPTEYLDFTWSADIAGFFALGRADAYDRGAHAHERFPRGSLFVLDAMGKSDDRLDIVTIGRGFLRPALQRGEFLRLSRDTHVQVAKFGFCHVPDSWI